MGVKITDGANAKQDSGDRLIVDESRAEEFGE